MTTDQIPPATTDWESLGRTLGESLTAFHSLVVCGMDPDATARVAVALAQVQARQRRVAIGDLIGDVPALSGLVTDDDVHGLVDSFLYGISLTRIARPVPGPGELYVLPTGSEPPDYEEILGQPRWARLTSGFRELGALLVLVVPADAPRIAELVAQTDGAVIVGDRVPTSLPVSQVVTILRPALPELALAASDPHPLPPPMPPVTGVVHSRTSGPVAAKLPWPWPDPSAPVEPLPAPAGFSLPVYAAVGIVLTSVIALFVLWLARAPLPHDQARPRSAVGGGVAAESALLSRPLDSTGMRPPVRLVSGLHLANPEDSAIAARFAVRLATANTEAGAILKVRDDGRELPAVTLAPVMILGSKWFEVLCGAFTARAGADSLLNDLRARKLVDAASGIVVRVPYALLIDSIDAGRATAAVPGLVADHLERGLPAYALRQDNGTAWILVGAFETPEEAALYEASLRASATYVVPALVYRKGRMF